MWPGVPCGNLGDTGTTQQVCHTLPHIRVESLNYVWLCVLQPTLKLRMQLAQSVCVCVCVCVCVRACMHVCMFEREKDRRGNEEMLLVTSISDVPCRATWRLSSLKHTLTKHTHTNTHMHSHTHTHTRTDTTSGTHKHMHAAGTH